MKVRLPPRYKFNGNILGNPTAQILQLGFELEGNLVKWRGAEGKGFAFFRDNDSDATFYLLDKKSRAAESASLANFLIFDYESHGDIEFLDLSLCRWQDEVSADSLASMRMERDSVIDSWRDAFRYIESSDYPERVGLRTPQLGALHAIQAHWNVSDDVATVVMPTGTGKTDTMLAITVIAQAKRVLVVVPTDALRSQLTEKFRTLGVLKAAQSKILADGAKYPVVGMLCHTPKSPEEALEIFEPCNVVITTSSIAARCDELVRNQIADMCPYLYIDEAHHAEAPTWKEFKGGFDESRVLQFTATPFREDEKHIDGRIIFRYPLAKAQAEGYFRPITFESVVEFNPDRVDEAIAAKAIEVLRADTTGKHILMARAKNVLRATDVFEIYKQYAEFAPVVLHVHISDTDKAAAKRKLFKGESRIVVCVDMLGEGFDLPELKIAAFHDIRKTLAVTLQLAGRFTRSRSDLGNATFIANTAEVSVREELQKLYSQDPDWNVLLPPMSDGAIDDQIAHQEYLEGFTRFPAEFPLRELRPAASTVIYKTKCERWSPHAFQDGLYGAESYEQVHVSINEREKMLVSVVGRSSKTDWADLESIRDWSWSLYIVLWDETQKLLFVHGSSNQSEFKSLAIAVAGENVELLRAPQLFRCFHEVGRLMLTNVGLTEQLGRQVRYTGRMGADVGTGMSDAQKRNSSKAVLFGAGYEKGGKMTVGASKKGRVWSFQRCDLHSFASWCKSIGRKVLDEKIDPNIVLRGTLEPEFIAERPAVMPMLADWPEELYGYIESVFTCEFDGENVVPMHMLSLELIEPAVEGNLQFRVFCDDAFTCFELRLFKDDERFDYEINRISGSHLTVRYRGKVLTGEKFFDTYPPVFFFVDGSYLDGNQYVVLKGAYPPYDKSKIIAWDWKGVDLTMESQGIEKRKQSIQRRVIDNVLTDDSFSVVMDDDDAGESADVVAIREVVLDHAKEIDVFFYHCKFSKPKPGTRVDDLFVVCGQAQKSIGWLYNSDKRTDLFQHLLKRDPRRRNKIDYTRFERGNRALLTSFKEMSRVCKVNLYVFIVQPGVKVSQVSAAQLDLLAATENYLMETCKLPFAVIASA